jgi:hypothetical protein
MLPSLHTVNLTKNFIDFVPDLSCLKHLHTLNLSQNNLSTVESLQNLRKLKTVSCLEIMKNGLQDPAFLDVFLDMTNLGVLYAKDNPALDKIRMYRKTLVARVPTLKYLDDKPIFEHDRLYYEAWYRGGLPAEQEMRGKKKADEEATRMANFNAMKALRNRVRAERIEAGLPVAAVVEDFREEVLAEAKGDFSLSRAREKATRERARLHPFVDDYSPRFDCRYDPANPQAHMEEFPADITPAAMAQMVGQEPEQAVHGLIAAGHDHTIDPLNPPTLAAAAAAGMGNGGAHNGAVAAAGSDLAASSDDGVSAEEGLDSESNSDLASVTSGMTDDNAEDLMFLNKARQHAKQKKWSKNAPWHNAKMQEEKAQRSAKIAHFGAGGAEPNAIGDLQAMMPSATMEDAQNALMDTDGDIDAAVLLLQAAVSLRPEKEGGPPLAQALYNIESNMANNQMFGQSAMRDDAAGMNDLD